MKKLSVIAILLLGVITASAQHPIYPFFDENGAVRIETVELNDAADTLVTVFHRADDIVYSRIVYRIIDMRYKQNYQLYFPTRSDDPEYRSLFKVILDGMVNGLDVYSPAQDHIKPTFSKERIYPKEALPVLFLNQEQLMAEAVDSCSLNPACDDRMLLHYDSISDQLSFNFYPYESFVRNQLKFLIQEVIFFDKHTSRLYSKIIGIAPLFPGKISNTDDENIMLSLQQSILFWIPFDALRPYLAKQYVIPEKNDIKRVTFDEFFAKKLYTAYIVGDSNMYDRMILNYTKDEIDVHKEQQRIFDEMLNFEQDLWEY